MAEILDEQKPGGESTDIKQEDVLAEVNRNLIDSTPTAENVAFFAVRLALLRKMPAAQTRDDIQAAIQIAQEKLRLAEVDFRIKAKATFESIILDRGKLINELLRRIELQLARPDLTHREQLALKNEDRRVRRELVSLWKNANHVINELLA